MKQTKDFHLKQFSIYGGQSGMAVSTDGIVLGAWAGITEHSRILDIGTGTGLLSLMCAQRTQHATITALDIDDDAIQAASINIQNSPWSSRITLEHIAVQAFTPPETFDHIICNPPYFNSGVTSNWQARATARHTHNLSHLELLTACQRLLKHEGGASFILPNAEGVEFIAMAQQQGWFVEQLCQVNTTQRKPAYRLLFTLVRYPTETQQTQLTIRQDNHYTAEFINLTRDFYLKMS
ncbi:tRNA1(Val) (adenine(37)-N6)-methyltransferase [Vibrio aphrogenes]|uniref:tRNA1(Val) (adenine(37)-N6)-methyltransferase n=1 Tax=Vibrio aphrogenes TaxID=1891186 RepID=UPI000B34AC9A|nr:methyltransferase [Vibrio aphrogenes]